MRVAVLLTGRGNNTLKEIVITDVTEIGKGAFTECKLLETEAYQEKVAWAIYMGIMQYLNAK
mgnify:CR=1 FL=1